MRNTLLAAALVCCAQTASAAIIDFNTGTTQTHNPITNSGFTFDFVASGWFIGDPGNAFYPNGVTNGSGILLASGNRGGTANVTMSLTGGGTFDIFSLMGTSSTSLSGNTLNIVGNLFGGGTVSDTLNLGTAFASYSLNGFVNLTSVVFQSGNSGTYNNAGFALDDISLDNPTPVPLPAGMPLLLIGLAGFAFVRNARKT